MLCRAEVSESSVEWSNLEARLRRGEFGAARFLWRETCRLVRRESRRMQLYELLRSSVSDEWPGGYASDEDCHAPFADLVQEAQLRFWSRLTRQEIRSPRGLLAKIVHDLLVDWIRSQMFTHGGRGAGDVGAYAGKFRVQNVSLPACDHDDYWRDTQAPVSRGFDRGSSDVALTIEGNPELDETERGVLLLMYCADAGHEEVAERLGIEMREVKCARDRGIRKLRRKLCATPGN